eukprot:scaffold47219_cov26-Prasinocladus_malaysianus.AAC.1
MAGVELVGYTPGPASSLNSGAIDILCGDLIAYGVATVISVVDVRLPTFPLDQPNKPIVKSTHVLGVLNPGAFGGAITAVCWAVDCHDRLGTAGANGEGPLRSAHPLKLALPCRLCGILGGH